MYIRFIYRFVDKVVYISIYLYIIYVNFQKYMYKMFKNMLVKNFGKRLKKIIL